VAVHAREAERMNRAADKSGLTFGVMFQERSRPVNQKAKEMIDSGELGELVRAIWIVTHSFRTQAYYDSGTWRATWAGEGGGVLLNQAPHFLDTFQWLAGMPQTVHGHAYLGKYHKIAVEDDVTAYVEYPNGATGIFMSSTGELPGTSHQEICGDRGKLVIQGNTLTFYRTRRSVKDFRDNDPGKFPRLETWKVDVPIPQKPAGHQIITQNFVNAIIKGEPLLAPGKEGINSLSLGNAMLMSGLTGKPVSLPLDGDAYEKLLNELIAKEKASK
jgi:predicted dehydrogenase